jgi:hypothetical protein
VRVLAFAVAIVLALVATTRADDDSEQDEDGEIVPFPKRSVALSFGGHGTRIDGNSESGIGAALELAVGRGRWQYFGEGGLASSALVAPLRTSGSAEGMIRGRMAHAGLGVRWLARQFRPSSSGGVELFLLSRAGVQRFYFDDGTRVGRPELAFGFGLQGRVYKRPRIAFRMDARVLYTPCRDCMDDSGSSTGFSSGIGFAW